MPASGLSKYLQDKIPKHKHKYVDEISQANDSFFATVAFGLTRSEGNNIVQRKLIASTIQRTSMYTTGFRLPFRVRSIRRFERKNEDLDLAINVYTLSSREELILIYKSKSFRRKHQINLLFLRNEEDKFHYLYINNLDLLKRQPSDRKLFTCFDCETFFTRQDALDRHCKDSCPANTNVVFPQGTVEFDNYFKTVEQPIFGILDFESSLVPVSRLENGIRYNCVVCANDQDPKNCMHATADIHRQIPTTYSIIFVDLYGDILYHRTESCGGGVMPAFFATLSAVESWLRRKSQRFSNKTDYTEEEIELFENSDLCYLCHEDFDIEDDMTDKQIIDMQKVRDHCHYTNRYLGAAHNNCNRRRFSQNKFPIFVHNFKNYDSHFIIQALQVRGNKAISALPLNMEKFRTLTVGKMTFIDSNELIPGALTDLVDNLRKSDHDFRFLDKTAFCNSTDDKALLLRKGVFPYEWAESIQKLRNTIEIPSREDFFSHLSQETVSEDDYIHAQKVFSHFQCKNMLEYCELYCKLDTTLLLEVIWNFREIIMNSFGLDCTWYISIPQLAFDCMLKTVKQPMKLMPDPEMVLMCEQNIRGGVSFINERHVQLTDYSSDENVVQDHLLYTDANNLYSVAQSAYVPLRNFKWCDDDELSKLQSNILTIPNDCDTGYILDVDLEYPLEIQDMHADMPLAPSHKEINFTDLSPYSQECLSALRGERIAKRYKAKKLCSTLEDKKNYVIHYRNLKTYIQLGMRLTKIHRAVKFLQAPVLKDFIEMCTEMRQRALTVTEKSIWKLCCNSIYGKFIQDNRRFMKVKFAQSGKSFLKSMISDVFYKGHRILNENTVAVFLNPITIKLNRLYAIGFTILELSKEHMYSSFYKFMRPALGGIENVGLVLTDTDSLLLHVKKMSRKEMLDRLSPIMDFSNYPSTHSRFDTEVKAVPGYFKDENCGNFMTEVVGLRSKCYITAIQTLAFEKASFSIVCKGVSKQARQTLTIDMYRSCIYTFKQIKTKMYCIRSKNHKLYTQSIRKIALSSADDKRFLLSCGVHTVPYGYSLWDFDCEQCQQNSTDDDDE